MDILQRIKEITEARGMTLYDLSKRCGFSNNTVYNWYSRNNVPSLDSLKIVCEKGFEMSLVEFFAVDCELLPATPITKEAVDIWIHLTEDQRSMVKHFVDFIKQCSVHQKK